MANREQNIMNAIEGALRGYIGYKTARRENEQNTLENLVRYMALKKAQADIDRENSPFTPRSIQDVWTLQKIMRGTGGAGGAQGTNRITKANYDAAFNNALGQVRNKRRQESNGMETTRVGDRQLAHQMAMQSLGGNMGMMDESEGASNKQNVIPELDKFFN